MGKATTTPAVGDSTIRIAEFLYEPETLTVKAGSTITWANQDRAPHTATAADNTTFDTGSLGEGEKGGVTFDDPGTYAYYCEFHPFMKATIEVK